MGIFRPLAVFVCLGAALGCAKAAGAPYRSVRIEGVPHVRQLPDFCGEACVEMYLRKRGADVDQKDVFNVSGVDPALGRGAYTAELKRAVEKLGFAPGRTWYTANPAHAAADLEARFAEMHADLVAGIPSIVCMHYDGSPNTTEHFRLVLGYDAATDAVIFHEPAEADGAYRRMPRATFLSLWPLKYDAAAWTVIRLRLKLDEVILPPPVPAPSPADRAQQVMRE